MKYIVYVVVWSIFYSCSTDKIDSTTKTRLLDYTDSLIGRKVVFNPTLIALDSLSGIDAGHAKNLLSYKSKVLSIVDASCPKCVESIALKDSLVHSKNPSIPIVYILNIENVTSFMKHIKPSIQSEALFLLDTAYVFESVNNLFLEDVSKRTFLLDENNCIRAVGYLAYSQHEL